MDLFGKEVRGIERAMDGLSRRMEATALNLANVHTPGYARRDVKFEDSLAEVLDSMEVPIDPERTEAPEDPSYLLEQWQPRTEVDERRPQRLDGNGVVLEKEVSAATQAALRFNVLATSLAGDYRDLKFVIDAK
ncbi:MAG: flagellar basal body rod protein FlgB [Candidatus Sericytochromatia bacterium]|nr:flagellar basal body rod protein FlgB [Candidatus Sericytochromatia bacterium]